MNAKLILLTLLKVALDLRLLHTQGNNKTNKLNKL